MAIKWFNIRSKEVRVAETEPQITAMWASSDHSPNITQGQDFGWRLAPEVVVELERIKKSEETLLMIAKRYNRPLEDVREPEILQYISEKTSSESAPVASDADYSDEYEAEIRRLRHAGDKGADVPSITQETVTTTTTKSIEDLEAELAARKAAVGQTTTTTTTEKPVSTTTTTTKK